MRFGYNTNGFAHHRLEDALRIIAGLGYESAAISLEHNALNPYEADVLAQAEAIRKLLENLRLSAVVETGARFLLDPWRKHQPTLISGMAAERELRLDFLCDAVRVARELGTDIVSFWSGAATDNAPEEVLLNRLCEGCRRLCDFAAGMGTRVAFEPEPGMFIDTMARFAELQQRVRHPALGLTLDIGHLHCMGEAPIAKHIERWSTLLWNVHIEDMRRGVHDHLMFGEGEIDFAPVLTALRHIRYGGGVYVELSRHSHDAVETARRALTWLKNKWRVARGQ